MWLLFTTLTAQAGLFSKKTMHAEWPARQTQADFVLPKGWMRLELSADHKTTGKWRDETGALQSYGSNAKWSYSRAWLKFNLGFSRRLRFYMHAPWVRASLKSDLGTRITTTALGDAHAGVVFQPTVGREKVAVATKLDVKTPSGVEWPRNFLGGPTGTSGFLTGTGATNVGLHVLARVTPVELLAVRLRVAYILKIPAVAGYVVEKDGFGNGWIDPGDDTQAQLDVQVSPVDHLAFTAFGSFSLRQRTKMGISGEGVTRTQLNPIDNGGVFVNLGLEAHWELHENVDIGLSGRHQLVGADTTTFAALGLEELSPQPGTTLAGSLGFRW